MRLLGAILAGGGSTRFGSDKALALLDGRPLVGHVRDRLGPQVAAMVVCGRPLAGLAGLDDWPAPGLGPLGGLAAALRHAAAHGFDAVLSVPCDAPRLPADLAARLGGGGARYVEGAPVIGLWPAALAPRLATFLQTDLRRSMRGWAADAGARAIDLGPIANVNRPDDLAALS